MHDTTHCSSADAENIFMAILFFNACNVNTGMCNIFPLVYNPLNVWFSDAYQSLR